MIYEAAPKDLTTRPEFPGLAEAYAVECTPKGMPTPVLDLAMYDALHTAGAMKLFLAESSGEIVGFATMLLARSPHYSAGIAVVESVFVAKEHRQAPHGARLLLKAMAVAKEYGVAGVFVNAPHGGALEAALAERHEPAYSMFLFPTGAP